MPSREAAFRAGRRWRAARGCTQRTSKRPTRARLGALVVSVLAVGACGSPSSAPAVSSTAVDAAPSPAIAPIEVITWGPDALKALTAVHTSRYPSDEIISATAELSGEARATLRRRMWRNEPPDLFQANVGHDLMQWVLVNGVDATASMVAPLDDVVPDVATWRRTIPACILENVSYGGKIYGVPHDVHRVNTLFYSKPLFARFGLKPPRTLADFSVIARRLRGTGVRPFGMGTKDPWVLSLFVFESLLVAREGPTFYESYFRGEVEPADPRIRNNLNAALELLPLFNDDHAQLTWLQGVDVVIRGDAAMTVMGDWARTAFNAKGWKLGVDYEAIPFPGTASAVVYTSDAYALPRLARNRAAAVRLLETIGSVEGQQTMNATKDALSARLDVPVAPGDGRVGDHALLERGKAALALSGLVPPRVESELAAALGEMDAQRDVEPVIQTLRTRHPMLAETGHVAAPRR